LRHTPVDAAPIPAHGDGEAGTPVEHGGPSITVSLLLDSFAPRAARFYVAQLDRPSPDLRDAAVLLTSELVSQAVQRCQFEGATIQLRAWMPADIVRVEVRAPRTFLTLPSPAGDADLGVRLFGQLADRWSIDTDGDLACLWFEIDRHPTSDA
jgi:hypothetical protein